MLKEAIKQMTIMPVVRQLILVVAILITSAFPETLKAQSSDRFYIKITRLNRNLNFNNASLEKWVELEKEYLNNVIRKNEFILQRDVLIHFMTEDNTEVLFIQKYKNWDDIEKAEKRNKELENNDWSDTLTRQVFFNYSEQYFDKNQSDEIFITSPGLKVDSNSAGKSLFYHLRVNHLAFPKDGTENEFIKLNEAFLKKSVYNNRFIKSYSPFIQVLGTNKRKYIEVTAVESLDDLENAFKIIDEFLYEPIKGEETKHKIFIDSYFKYFNGFHADYIYKSVPELKK
jgi:hypothetical protein